jgi:hypothetical protein
LTPAAGATTAPATGGGTTGLIKLSTGASTNGNSGALYIGSGDATTGNSGAIFLTGGTGDTGDGGAMQIKAGTTSANNAQGGTLTLAGGAGTSATGGQNGDVVVDLRSVSNAAMGTFLVQGGASNDIFKIHYDGSVTEVKIDSDGGKVTLNGDDIHLVTDTDTANGLDEIKLTASKITSDGAFTHTGGMTIHHGGLQVTGGLTVYGGVYVQDTGIISTAGITTSDQRLKTDIIPLPSPLSKVSKLRGVYFSWIKDGPDDLKFDDRRHVGVLAQDVQEVLPDAVDEIHGGKYLGVDYPALIPLLIEAIKELNERTVVMSEVEELMQIISKHEEMINSINDRLLLLETRA